MLFCSRSELLSLSHRVIFDDIFMAAFVLIAFSIGVDLYKVGVRCLESGFTVSSVVNALKEIHESGRAEKYLKCIDEIYEKSDFHSIGIECIICRGHNKIIKTKMICNNEIENALEVDGCEEAFEVISRQVSGKNHIIVPKSNVVLLSVSVINLLRKIAIKKNSNNKNHRVNGK